MLPWILAAFIAVPIAEIAVFVEAGSLWGLWPTIVAIFATAFTGFALVRQQGVTVLHEVRSKMNAGQFPTHQVFDGLCLLIAGAFLLTPGFITDTLGFILLMPTARHLVISRLTSRIRMPAARMSGANAPPGGQTIDGEFADVTKRSSPQSDSDSSPPTSL